MEALPRVSPWAAKTSGRWALSVADLWIFQLDDLYNKWNPYRDWGFRILGAVALFSKGVCIYFCLARILD